MSGRHAICFEGPSNGAPALACTPCLGDASHHSARDDPRASETHALSPLGSQRLLSAGAYGPALPLRHGGHDVGYKLTGWRGGVYAKVEGHEGPTAPLRSFKELGGVDGRPGGPVKLGDYQCSGLATLQGLQGSDRPRSASDGLG